MQASSKAADLIAEFEGFSPDAYPDPGTGNEPWTIGYGTTVYHTGVKVKKGDHITRSDALAELQYHLNQKVVPELNAALKVAVTQNQFDALCSFAYNCGMANLRGSTLLALVNKGADPKDVAAQFARWNKAAGKILTGLTRRRTAEAQLFLS